MCIFRESSKHALQVGLGNRLRLANPLQQRNEILGVLTQRDIPLLVHMVPDELQDGSVLRLVPGERVQVRLPERAGDILRARDLRQCDHAHVQVEALRDPPELDYEGNIRVGVGENGKT